MHHGEFFWNSKSLELPFLGFRLEIGQILTWKAVIYEKSLVSDFRKTVETGVDPRLHGDVLSTVSLT